MSFIQIKGTQEKIPVSKILCVGTNYAEHVAEMNPGKTVEKPSEPVIFMKPPSAIIHDGEEIVRPEASKEMHHEVEMIVVIGKNGKLISKSAAMDHVMGYAVGLDMTLRDLQTEFKKKGKPWTIAKGFDTSAAISDVILKSEIPNPMALDFKLFVNDQLRQSGNTGNMLFDVGDIISYISKFFTLNRGDVIYTGTPQGVGAVNSGDRLKAVLGEFVHLNIQVA